MDRSRSRYHQFERFMTYVLIPDGMVFLLYLLAAGLGIIWLKVITAIIAILASGLCLGFLYLNGELLRPRSRWMTFGAGAVLLLVILSLVLNYPSPNPFV